MITLSLLSFTVNVTQNRSPGMKPLSLKGVFTTRFCFKLTYKLRGAAGHFVCFSFLQYTRHSKVNQLEVFFTIRAYHTEHVLGLRVIKKDKQPQTGPVGIAFAILMKIVEVSPLYSPWGLPMIPVDKNVFKLIYSKTTSRTSYHTKWF